MVDFSLLVKQSDDDKANSISNASKAEDLDKATSGEFSEGIRSSGQRRLRELGLGIDFDLKDPRVVQFIAEQSGSQIVGINNRTRGLLRATLREGFENGEGINKLARRVRGVYADAQGRRSLVIARTESVRALNSGQVAATKQAGFEGKQWLSTQDPKVRDTHALATGMDGQIRPVNDNFESPSGAIGPFPGAMSTAEESVNCRCTTISVPKVDDSCTVNPGCFGEPAKEFTINEKPRRPHPEVQKWAKKSYEKWAEDLTGQEFKRINSYTGGGYRGINSDLRSRILTKEGRAIEKALEKTRVPENVVAWRGGRSVTKHFNVSKPIDAIGRTFKHRAFTSTSLDRTVAEIFVAGRTKVDADRVLYKILVPKNSRAGFVSPGKLFSSRARRRRTLPGDLGLKEESELLLQRGSQFRVVNVYEDQIQVDVILGRPVIRKVTIAEVELIGVDTTLSMSLAGLYEVSFKQLKLKGRLDKFVWEDGQTEVDPPGEERGGTPPVVWPRNLDTEERRAHFWKAGERFRIPIERRFRHAFRQGFEVQERAVLRALRETERSAALALHYERTYPMKDKDQLQVFTGRRLWTGERSARKLLTETPDELEGVLLQHPRIADVMKIKKGGGGGDDEDDKKSHPRRRRFRISTETKDRHGDVIRSKGIQLKNFRKNPVVLFAHDARQPPIGKSPKIERGDGILDADVEFFERDVFEFADTIFRIVEVGGLKAASIGFIPVNFERLEDEDGERTMGIDFKKIDLLEFSIVPLPANPEAVVRALSDGATMEPYLAWLDDMQDNWANVEELFAGLGVTADDVMEIRRAADGDKTVVATALTPEKQEELARANLAKIAETTPGIVLAPKDPDDPSQEPQELSFTIDSLGAVSLSGEPPERTEVSRELIERGDVDLVTLDDGALIFEMDDARVEYEVEEESDDAITGELVKLTSKGPITFQTAHPDGTPAQGRDAAWSASREVREASVGDLLIMAAWRESKPRDDLVKGDFKFPHHVASGRHAVNFRASTAGIAVLNGARGGANIPDGDRRGVWRHLARHIREDFDSEPPELRWVDVEPLKNHPDIFVYDYEEGRLMAWLEDDLLVDAKYIELVRVSRGEGAQAHDAVIVRASEIIYDEDEVRQGGFVIQTIAGRKSKWKSKEAFLEWAEDHDFRTDKVDTTRNFWRLRQQDPDDFERLRTICINPNDVEASSADCKVQAIGGPLKQAEDLEDEPGTLYDTLRDISLGYRASLIAEGAYGEELWDQAVDRLISPKSFFRIVDGEAVDLGSDLPENMEELDDERPVFARFIMDRRREDSLGRARVLDTDVKDMRGFAEAAARHIAEINENPDQIVVVGRAVGRLDGEEVYEDCAAFRWITTGQIVRISLGEEFSDPIAQVLEMAVAVHEAGQALSSADEYRIQRVVFLLSSVLERSKEKEQPESETAEDVIAELIGEDDESDGVDDIDFSQVDAKELSDILGDDIRERVSKVVRSSAREQVRKDTGAID